MKINELQIVKILDFFDFCITCLEKDGEENLYISHLYNFDDNYEYRYIVQVNENEYNMIKNKEITLYQLFNKMNKKIYLAKFDIKTGKILKINEIKNAEISPTYAF